MSVQPIVFGLYFLTVFAIGWFSLRKTRTELDYWIAGGNLGWRLGGATLAATHMSAGTFIGTVGLIYTAGWSFGWLLIAIPLGYWVMVAFLAPRFTRVKKITLPAYIETRYYSKYARGIAALIIVIATAVYIQAQVIASGLIGAVIFGFSPEVCMTVFTVVIIVYTFFGGMIAVVYTDLLQVGVMFFGVLFAIPYAFQPFDSVEHLFSLATTIKPQTFEWGALPLTLLFTMGMAFFLGAVSNPEKLTRLYTMKNMSTVRKGVFLTIIFVCLINLMVFLLALAGIALFPNLPSADLAMPLVADTLLPPILGAVMLAAILSAMMSTVDSLLLVAGAALSEDIYNNLIAPQSSRKNRLNIARLGILCVGISPLLMISAGIGEGALIQFIVVLFSALMAASFCVPVVAGVVWKRATREGAIASMIGGVTTTMLWKAFGPAAIDPVFPGFLASLVLMICVSLLTPPPPPEATASFFEE